jgi:hypothetical protein
MEYRSPTKRSSSGQRVLSTDWEYLGRNANFCLQGLDCISYPDIHCPEVIVITTIILMVVVLPAPLGPRNPKTSPPYTLKITLLTAHLVPYFSGHEPINDERLSFINLELVYLEGALGYHSYLLDSIYYIAGLVGSDPAIS